MTTRSGSKGTVWKRPDGTWAYRVALGRKPDGTLHRRQRNGFATRRDANDALVGLLNEAAKGGIVVSTSQTLATYLESWLESVESSLRPSTFDQYTRVLGVWVIPYIGGVRLADVNPPLLQNLYTTLSASGKKDGTGLSPSSVNSTHRILRRALDQAVEWQLLARNPASVRINRPRQSGVAAAAWTPAQAQAFLAANRDHRLYAMFVVMLTTGIRRGEAIGLRWEDVDLGARTITIRHTRVVVKGQPQVSEPKTKAGVRVVELGASAVRALDKHQANDGDDEYVFTTRGGSPIHPQNLRRVVEVACRKAGLPMLTPKGFRHTAATCALKAGVHPKKVQEMLGHSNIQVTLGVYTHVLQGMHRDAADAMDTALFPEEEA